MQLSEQHYKIMELMLQGMPRQAIADRLDLTHQQVSLATNSKPFIEEYDKIKDELCERTKGVVEESLQRNAPLALAQIVALSQGATAERVKLNASQDILDRAGYKPVDKHIHELQVNINEETMIHVNQVLMEMGEIVDSDRQATPAIPSQ